MSKWRERGKEVWNRASVSRSVRPLHWGVFQADAKCRELNVLTRVRVSDVSDTVSTVVYFTAADGTRYRVYDATFSNHKHHTRPIGDPTATVRVFVLKDGTE